MKKYVHISRFLIANRQNVMYAFVLSALLMLPAALSPIFRKVFTDTILTGGVTQWMPTLLLLMIGVALFSAALTWLKNSFLLKLSNKIELSQNAVYFWKLLNSTLRFFNKHDSFALLSNLDASKKISRIITQAVDILFSVISAGFYFVMMLRLNVKMAMIVVGLVIVSFLIEKARSQISYKLEKIRQPKPKHNMNELIAREYHINTYGLQSVETFKAAASETTFFQQLMDNKGRIVNARLQDDYEEAYTPLENFSEILFANLLLYIAALDIMGGNMSIGTYLALSAYAGSFFTPMNEVIRLRETFTSFEKRLTYMERELGADDKRADMAAPVKKAVPVNMAGHIRIENVSFEYEPGNPVLENFSLTVEPGQRIAIIGPPGAGKTTLLKLLTGLYAPTSGTITIDGVDITEMDRHLLAACIGYASQEATILSASVRDNIALWDASVTDSDIYRAAGAACFHEYVTAMGSAYDCMLLENGGNLSGGQRQLLEITRAFLYEPTILLFDEATRSVDRKNVAAVEREIMRRGCTYLEVTHIISRNVRYDEIIVMDKGKITARGSHEKMLSQSDYYAAIYHSEGGAAV